MTLPRIEELIPHSGRMVLLDRLIFAAGEQIIAEVVLREDSPFVRERRARAIVMLEYMAQAVACYAGLADKKEGRPVEIGYLIGARELTLAVDFISAGDHLEVEAIHEFGDANLGSFRACVRREGQELARANLTVYRGAIPEDAR